MAMETPTLDGRVAVVTGASSGIGAATAELLARRGARVALLARRRDRLEELSEKINANGGTSLPVTTDVVNPESLSAAGRRVAEELGAVDLVVNNAGVALPAPIEEQRSDQWQREIDVNVSGALHTVRTFLPALTTAAARAQAADLVNISSIAAHIPFPGFAVYGATKAAITHLSQGLRAELGARGVRVTSIEPGLVATEIQGHMTDPGVNEWLAEARRLIKWLDAEHIAEVIAFVVAQPRHVNLPQIVAMPTGQV